MTQRVYAGIRENAAPGTHAVAAMALMEDNGLQSVLDIPCGDGAFSRRLRDRGLQVYGADCRAPTRVADVPFIVCNMNAPLPFRTASVDAIACLEGLAHLERPFDFIRECARVLEPGGIIVVSTPNGSSLRSRWRWLWTGFHNKRKTPLDEARVSPQHLLQVLSFDQVRYLLHTNRFRVVAIRTNRVKPVSWLYAVFVPVAYAITWWVFQQEEGDGDQRARNREILRQMFSRPVLFGETLIVTAVRS